MKRATSRNSLRMFGLGLGLFLGGCGAPSQVNVGLRKQNQQLESQVAQLRLENQAAQHTIIGLRDRQGALPTLPTTRLAQLFTTAGIEFGRLVGGVDLDPNKPGDEGLAVYVVPVDESGERIKSAGSFQIEAFDLADAQNPLIGKWVFDLQQSRNAWTSVLIEHDYVFTCPWQSKVPQHPELTIKVKFFDELTQTSFTAQRVVRVNLPSSRRPR